MRVLFIDAVIPRRVLTPRSSTIWPEGLVGLTSDAGRIVRRAR